MAGYSPAINNQSNLPQSTVKYYDKKFRENLKAQTPFVACSERLDLPMKSGNQYQMFMYVPLAANTTQATEGTVGTSLSVSVLSNTATIGEYADYANFSSLSLATAIDNTVENVAREMSYRLGESLSALVRATADGANAIDTSVLVQLAASSTSSFTALSLSQIRNAVQSLAGRSVRPFDEASKAFCGVIHPFALGDVLADNSNDAPIDILKHTPVGLARMEELVSVDLTEVIELPSSGVHFFQTNQVTTTANYKSVTGLTALRTYIFGRDGIFSINLGAQGDTGFGDGEHQNIKCNVVQNAAPSVADPEGLIPGWTSYRVHFTTTLGPDTTIRQRQIDAASAIS
jgi:N4-gp56 family major capsid protein